MEPIRHRHRHRHSECKITQKRRRREEEKKRLNGAPPSKRISPFVHSDYAIHTHTETEIASNTQRESVCVMEMENNRKVAAMTSQKGEDLF
jgi:hypothetical protein